MKPTIIGFAALIILILVGLLKQHERDNIDILPKEKHFFITTYNGCEYIEVIDYPKIDNYNITHKGNCKNPVHYFKDNNQYKYVINLPEEFPLISADVNHPDSLTGYISRDTLYINFLKHY